MGVPRSTVTGLRFTSSRKPSSLVPWKNLVLFHDSLGYLGIKPRLGQDPFIDSGVTNRLSLSPLNNGLSEIELTNGQIKQ